MRLADGLGYIFQPRLECGPIGQDLDANLGIFFLGEAEQEKPAAIFKDDIVRPDAWEMHVEFIESSDLAELFFFGVVGPDIGALVFVAVGEEIERRAVPHRLRIGGVVASDVFSCVSFEVEQPDGGIHPAAIAFPSAKIGRDRDIGESFAVGRNRTEFAVGQGQAFGQAAIYGDLVEFIEAILFAGARGGEENGSAVGIPFEHAVGRAVISQALGQTAGRGNDIYVHIAVVIAAEGDLGAIG